MTVRTKTTHWGLVPVDTATVNGGNRRTCTATTIYVPETTSRVFKSAIIEVSFFGVETTATDTVLTAVGLTVNAARATLTPSYTMYHSGESHRGVLQFDFGSHVETNFGAGTSQSLTFDIEFASIGTNNVSATLALTYDYDDEDVTHCKSVMLPLYGFTNAIATSTTSYGDIVPILTGASGLLKEDSIAIRDYYIILEGNENANDSTTDYALNVQLDTEGYTTFGTVERALATEGHYRYIWSKKGAVPDTTAVHAFWTYCTVASHNCMTVTLVVTYEYDSSATTATYNSFQIPFRIGETGNTTQANAMVARIPIDFQEPDLTYGLTGAVKLYLQPVGAITASNVMRVAVGSGTVAQYTHKIASNACGSVIVLLKFSSSDFTFARGKCYINVYFYMSSVSYDIYNISGLMFLNYQSGIAATGIETHNHTVHYGFLNSDFILSGTPCVTYATKALAPLVETSWWLQGFGTWCWQYYSSTSQQYANFFYAQNAAGEGFEQIGTGWTLIASNTPAPVSETGSRGAGDIVWDVFKRHPADPKLGALSPTASRVTRMYSPRWCGSITVMIPYHAITYTKTGNVTGYAGTGAVTVNVHDSTTGEKLYSVTASAGGAYSVTMYDDTRDHFSQVYEDATHVGRSSNWKAA